MPAVDPLSLYRRIRSDIEANIRSGRWAEGHRIPFEHELAIAYGCSRATVSKAVAALAEAGLIDRRKRAGSFVASARIHSAVLEIPDIADLVRSRGEDYRYQRLARSTRKARVRNPEEAIFAGRLLVLSGVHCANGAPFAHESRLVAVAAVPGILDAQFGEEAPGSWLLREIGWTRATHKIAAVNPDAAIAQALAIDRATACLRLERTTWAGDQPITHACQTFIGHRHDLVAEFTAGTGKAP
jgi:GntR family histidine utilization transcriptional repressor